MPAYRYFVGMDIAAATAVVTWGTNPHTLHRPVTIRQNENELSALIQQLNTLTTQPSEVLVVMEITGNYWQQWAYRLHDAGFIVSVLNPAQAHFFAQAKLKKVKSDPVDARLLAELGMTLDPKPWTPPAAVYERLQQLLLQRDALIDMRVFEENRLHALVQRVKIESSVKNMLQEHIAYLREKTKVIEQQIQEALASDTTVARPMELLCSIPGIGEITAAWILTTTLNFQGCETPEQVTAYAGLAPYERRSGTSLHTFSTIGHGGNTRLRRALYMASISAVRWNPIIRPFYQRLRASGKATKVAMCAAARKLLHIAWAVVTKQQMFDPNYANKSRFVVDHP